MLATLIAVYYRLYFGESDGVIIDFVNAPSRSALLSAYIGHYACCAADTWASELGVLSNMDPVLITTFQRVPPGTNGGVSLIGTLASGAGGLFIGLLYYATSMISGSQQPSVLALGVVIGVLGSVLDSILGATVQSTWYNRSTHKICAESLNEPDHELISGMDVLTNEQVNAVSVFIATILSPWVATKLF